MTNFLSILVYIRFLLFSVFLCKSQKFGKRTYIPHVYNQCRKFLVDMMKDSMTIEIKSQNHPKLLICLCAGIV
jgi:hypothetical protein